MRAGSLSEFSFVLDNLTISKNGNISIAGSPPKILQLKKFKGCAVVTANSITTSENKIFLGIQLNCRPTPVVSYSLIDTKKGEFVWSKGQYSLGLGPMLFFKGDLYLNTGSELKKLSTKTGNAMWSIDDLEKERGIRHLKRILAEGDRLILHHTIGKYGRSFSELALNLKTGSVYVEEEY